MLTFVLPESRLQFDALFGPSGASAYVLLNGPPVSQSLLSLVRPACNGRPFVVADGAADLVRSALPSLIPSHIVGDMDSASSDVVEYFKSRGTRLVPSPNQNANDFTKSMKVAIKHRANKEDPILVLGGQPGGGRLDQFFGNIQELCVQAEQGVYVWWVGEHTVSMVLRAGRHSISVDPTQEGPMCGLVPIAGAVEQVTTFGLRWNFINQETRFGVGGVVSSSNEIVDASVSIDTSGPLLWTCDIKVNGQ
jgi:thiamine pyrophosphokinase